MKKQGHVLNIPKKLPKPRQSHFGTYGTRQPVTGSDHKRNLHDKVDNFKREDGFRRRTVKGVEQNLIQPRIDRKHKKSNFNFLLRKPKTILASILFLSLFLLLVFTNR